MAKSNCIIIAILTAWLVACDNEQGQYHSVGAHGWAYADTLIFTPKQKGEQDTLPYEIKSLAVAIRHTNAYEYSNIWIEVTTPQPDTLMVDTFNIKLADIYGHWYGNGIGVGYQCVDTLMHNFSIEPGKPILLRHIMRADTLPGIEQAGIIIWN